MNKSTASSKKTLPVLFLLLTIFYFIGFVLILYFNIFILLGFGIVFAFLPLIFLVLNCYALVMREEGDRLGLGLSLAGLFLSIVLSIFAFFCLVVVNSIGY